MYVVDYTMVKHKRNNFIKLRNNIEYGVRICQSGMFLFTVSASVKNDSHIFLKLADDPLSADLLFLLNKVEVKNIMLQQKQKGGLRPN